MSDAASPEDDPVERVVEGPTPLGGVRMHLAYLDDAGAPTRRSRATQVRIVEFDEAGATLATTLGSIQRQP